MASILRRGRIPVPPTGLSEYIDQVYSIKGFFGPWAQLFRRHNTAHVVSASRPDSSRAVMRVRRTGSRAIGFVIRPESARTFPCTRAR